MAANSDTPERLLRQLEPIVYYWARRYALPAIPCEDLQQEGRIGAWKAIQEWEPSRASLRTFASRRIESHIRHARRDKRLLIAIPAYVQEQGESAHVPEVVELSEEVGASEADFERVEDLLAFEQRLLGLSANERDLLRLRFVQELEFSEAAAILKRPVPTLKKWQQKALQTIKAAA